jgi:anti-sigma factor RsiW
MARRIARHDEDALAGRLKREAEALRPAFSEELHTRICRAVRQSGARPDRPAPVRSWSRRLVYAALAATLLISASLIALRLSRLELAPPGPRGVAPRIASTTDPLAGVEALIDVTDDAAEQVMLVDSTLIDRQWAYLDHDVRMAAGLLIDQLRLDLGPPSEQDNPL